MAGTIVGSAAPRVVVRTIPIVILERVQRAPDALLD
jgi:hypothetical protein